MILEVQDLKKSFQQGGTKIEVLQGLNLCIDRPGTVAILGQSGSGKSTLLSLLAGLDTPTSGRVAIADTDLASIKEDKLAQFRAEHLGIVFQQFHLMSNLTALENVSLPLEIFRKPGFTQKAREALSLVGLAHRENHFPSELSGGEKQRVAIARAFVVRPNLLLADEPSGNLDSATGAKVMDLLFQAASQQHTSMILVTHNEDLAKRCDQVFELKSGKLQ